MPSVILDITEAQPDAEKFGQDNTGYHEGESTSK